jgi:hypothetical protein
MNSEPLKFVVLGEGERVVGTWEVLAMTPKVTLGKILATLVGLGIAVAMVLAPPVLVKFFAVIPLVVAFFVWIGTTEKGWLMLTDRRLIHYDRTTGPWRSGHGLSEMRIEDIAGLRAEIDRNWGLETARLYILSMYHDAITVATFASSVPILGRIPVVGRMFRDTNMGADTLAAIRDLYATVRATRAGYAAKGGGA